MLRPALAPVGSLERAGAAPGPGAGRPSRSGSPCRFFERLVCFGGFPDPNLMAPRSAKDAVDLTGLFHGDGRNGVQTGSERMSMSLSKLKSLSKSLSLSLPTSSSRSQALFFGRFSAFSRRLRASR